MHCLESFSLLTRYVLTMRKSICQNPTQKDGGKSGMPPAIKTEESQFKHRESYDVTRRRQERRHFPKRE